MSLTWLWAIGRGLRAGWSWATTGGHWKIVAGAMTALLLAYFIISYRSLRAENANLTEDLAVSRGETLLARQAAAANNAAAEAVSAARNTIARQEQIGRERTQAAIAANPEWASQPVPADIADSLRQ